MKCFMIYGNIVIYKLYIDLCIQNTVYSIPYALYSMSLNCTKYKMVAQIKYKANDKIITNYVNVTLKILIGVILLMIQLS